MKNGSAKQECTKNRPQSGIVSLLRQVFAFDFDSFEQIAIGFSFCGSPSLALCLSANSLESRNAHSLVGVTVKQNWASFGK